MVNLWGGPGTGKSTLMADVFAELKWRGVDCEQAPEFAKEKVWESTDSELDEQIVPPALRCQPYIFGKQHYIQFRLNGKVDAIITDSPLLLSLIYGRQEPKEFGACVRAYFKLFNNLNFFCVRLKKFNPNGRLQTKAQAQKIDKVILKMLKKYKIPFQTIEAHQANTRVIADIIEAKLKRK